MKLRITPTNPPIKRDGRNTSSVAYIFAIASVCVGIGASVVFWNPVYVLGASVVGLIGASYLLFTEIHHDRNIESVKTVGEVEVKKIEATHAKLKEIEGQARVITNWQAPLVSPPLEYRKLIQGDTTTLLPKSWTYLLKSGEEARGDLIEAIVAAAFDDHDPSIEMRTHIRNRYQREFGNNSYSKAVRAIQESGAVDKTGDWTIEADSAANLLREMRQVDLETPMLYPTATRR